MRFGLTILPEHRWAQAAPMWRRAEELGFDHAWTYDHLVWGGLPGGIEADGVQYFGFDFFGVSPVGLGATVLELDRVGRLRSGRQGLRGNPAGGFAFVHEVRVNAVAR